MSVTREQRLAKLVVKSTTTPKTTEIDQLTKAIQTFSVNLLQQVQPQQSFQQIDGFYRQYPSYVQQLLANTDSLGSAFREGLS